MNISLVDLHTDAITELSPEDFAKFIKNAAKCGVSAISVSVWTTEMQNPMEQIRRYKQQIAGLKTTVKLLLHIEDAWFVNEQNIDEFIGFKPYSVGIVWNENNNLAGGAFGNGDVTPLGETVIRKLVKNGVKVDLAHLNRKSFFSTAKILQNLGQKLLCTHTCFAEINSHPRNLDREQVQTIVNSGGVVGLTLVGDFLTANKTATQSDVLAHINYFRENFPTGNLAFGTDFYGTKNLPSGIKNYNDLQKFISTHKITLQNPLG